GLNYTAGGGTTSGGTPTPRATNYVYDALNRLARVDNPQGSTRYQYDLSGLLLRTLYPNNASISQSYDGAGRILALEHRVGDTLVSQFQYQYDANGNRLQQIARNGSTLETTTYTYDTLDRLQQVTYPEQQVTYAYDAVYNRIRETTRDTANNQVTKDQGFSYNLRNELLAIKDLPADTVAVSYQYDANGNQTQKQKAGVTTDFVYDIRDHLRQVMQGGSSVGQFLYDARGLRVEKLGNRGLERYTYDDQSVLAQLDSTNQPIAHYDYGPGRLMALTHRDEGTAFYHFDALGSIVNLTTTAGAVQTRTLYDAWGHHRLQEGDSWNRFGFTGHEEDPETGLVYAKARFYDPDVGRFLSMDAWEGDLTLAPSLHKYLYAYGNPLVWVDPFGHQSQRAHRWVDENGITHYGYNPPPTKQEKPVPPPTQTKPKEKAPDPEQIAWEEKQAREKQKIREKIAEYQKYCDANPRACSNEYYRELQRIKQEAERKKALTKESESTVLTADELYQQLGIVRIHYFRSDYREKLKQLAVVADIASGFVAAKGVFDVYQFVTESPIEDIKTMAEYAIEHPEYSGAALALLVACKAKCKDIKYLADDLKGTKSGSGRGSKNSGKSSIGCKCCFTKDTLVLTNDGYKAIDKIKVGEFVFAKSDETGEVGWKAVTHKFVYDDNRLTYKLVLKSDDEKEESFELTDNHLFYVLGTGWVEAINLRPGMMISGYNGSELQVVSLEALNQSPITYNLEVEDYHTFFVGELGVWVHNNNCCVTWSGSGPAEGILGLNASSKSNKAIMNYFPKKGESVEFIFDTESKTFLVGTPGKFKHYQLANSIGAKHSNVVGGMFSRGKNGEFVTNEFSGTFWRNWNSETRKQFVNAMQQFGVKVSHSQ
ncbi:hypothetical protein KCM76_18315, partial [Zooshikella marina]